MKVLVTGGTGVVGTAAIPALLHSGHEVRLLSRHADQDARSFAPGVEPFEADVSDPSGLQRAVDGCDCVVHIAGIVEENPPDVTFEKVNIQGTKHLLAAAEAANAPRFLYISSLGAERGQSEYHQSKCRAEELVRNYPGAWLILRPGNVYGPGDETISMLLKMVRSLPAVPMISGGEQPFQPIWYADFGHALAQAVGNPDLVRDTLELAGPDVTTTVDVLDRLAVITGRNPPRLDVPVWVTEVGVQSLEAFGAAGKKLLQRAGIGVPLKSATVTMLLEENLIPRREDNALLSRFDIAPTGIADGLETLADLLPEQLPGDGVGQMQQTTYAADIQGSRYAVPALLDLVCANLRRVMPIEFAAEPGAPTTASPGTTLTARIPGRGHVQVRLAEKTKDCATFVTLEGHPIAGLMQLCAEDIPNGVRFSVRLSFQPANVIDWVALRTVGGSLQSANWRGVVRRVVDLSGGITPNGVQRNARPLAENEQADLRHFAERIVEERQRVLRDEQVIAGMRSAR